jgi:cephalosporin hydroxylase|tara:strand:- start:10893 stop:11459 length:567 start_codon:yes stop_codon:yes gene_type:complete
MIRVKEELAKLVNKFDFINCIETGTIRTYTEKHESTRHISELVGEKGNLKSVDIEQKSLDISKDICKNAANVEWILSDSIEYLKKDNDKYHFVLLDSVNDANHILEEFKLVAKRIHSGGALMIDDAGVGLDKIPFEDNGVYAPKKAVEVNKFLQDIGADYEIVVGGHPGNQLLLKATPENIQKIESSL